MSPSTPTLAPAKDNPDVAEENPDLIRFRQEWLAELRRQGKALNTTAASKEGRVAETSNSQPLAKNDVAGSSAHQPAVATAPSSPLAKSTQTVLTSHPALENGGIVKQFAVSKSLETALGRYSQAVEHEQRGELDEALVLYRQAFRLVCLATRCVDTLPAQLRQTSG